MVADTETAKFAGKQRVLLDSNVWRYVIDSKCQGALLRVARTGGYAIQIAPAVLYEAFRIGDSALRSALIKLMTDLRFRRLMPEAYSESVEILHEVERLRPDWLRTSPQLTLIRRLEKDWTRKTGGFWVRCARSPQSEAQFIQRLEGPMMDNARGQAQFARKEMIEAGWKTNPPMDKTLVRFSHPVPGWRGDDIEAWRVDALAALSYSLGIRGDPYRDWLGPFIELDRGLLRSTDWVEFWLYSVESRNVPRQWMRWAHSFAQRFRKVTPGSPADSQLFTYFLDTDLVISADRALIEILDECRPFAPCPLPAARAIAGGAAGVTELLRILNNSDRPAGSVSKSAGQIDGA
ncbi:hypothetical protein [Bradyrhizobium sp. SZCCHNS3002]|uniref:hypothetical protein n=1 Tax=Bradyrhizobium sp. SZCCHNS3002 TaxID=3057310 RepID=UPI0028EB15FF|nr:hypothetical protein [Bradyrhizobium sp. SZCCHNS3002]